ncbi:hypothetical protein D3C80_1250510 [compost metagenome]
MKSGARGNRGAAVLAQGQSLGVVATVPALVGANIGDMLEGRVGDVVGDHAAHRQFGAAVDLYVLEVVAELLGQVAQEGVRCFVVMLVAVVDRVVDSAHALILGCCGWVEGPQPLHSDGFSRLLI